MNKLLTNISTIIFIVFVLCIGTYAENEDLIQKEYQSLNTYQTVIDQLNLHDSLCSWQYPDYYAGMYINDNKDLVFLLNKNTTFPTDIAEYLASLDVKIEFTEHSLKELKKAQEDIFQAYSYAQADSMNTQAIYSAIDVRNNCLDVNASSSDILTCSLDDLSLDYVNIYHDQSFQFLGSILQPGRSINSPGSRTVGYWAQSTSGTLGIVTASHGSILPGSAVYVDGIYFGTAQNAVYTGTADAVFVRRDNLDFIPSNTLMGWGYTIQSNASISLPVGATVYSCGKTSGAKSGTVTKIGAVVNYGGLYIQDAVQASFSGAGGDSGGPVCGALSNNTVVLAGTIEALDNNQVIYCKAINIRTTLGVYPY